MNYADQLRAQLQKRKEQEPIAEVELPVAALGPDFKFKFVARRLDVVSMIFSGALPQHLAAKFAATNQNKTEIEDTFTSLPVEEQLATIALQRKMAIDVCVDPVIVDSKEPGKGEISVHELPYQLLLALFVFAMAGSPGVPVAIEGADGQPATTTVEAVESFRPEPELSAVLPNGADVSSEAAIRADAAQG